MENQKDLHQLLGLGQNFGKVPLVSKRTSASSADMHQVLIVVAKTEEGPMKEKNQRRWGRLLGPIDTSRGKTSNWPTRELLMVVGEKPIVERGALLDQMIQKRERLVRSGDQRTELVLMKR
jgi:hypothetical protein